MMYILKKQELLEAAAEYVARRNGIAGGASFSVTLKITDGEISAEVERK